MSQRGNAGKDLVQIGHDYFKHIQLNILSGNGGSVIIALIPLLLFLYGVKATGDTVAEFVDPKPSLPELPQDNSLLQAKEREIGELKKRLEDLQVIKRESAKYQKQVEALQKTLKQQQTKLDNQKNLIQQKDQKIQTLEVENNDLKTQLSKAPESPRPQPDPQEPPFGTARKSWCLAVASGARARVSHGIDISAAKASMEESNCSFWGVSIP